MSIRSTIMRILSVCPFFSFQQLHSVSEPVSTGKSTRPSFLLLLHDISSDTATVRSTATTKVNRHWRYRGSVTRECGDSAAKPRTSSARAVPKHERTVSDVLVKMRNGTAAEARQSLLILSPEGDIQRISCSAVACEQNNLPTDTYNTSTTCTTD